MTFSGTEKANIHLKPGKTHQHCSCSYLLSYYSYKSHVLTRTSNGISMGDGDSLTMLIMFNTKIEPEMNRP